MRAGLTLPRCNHPVLTRAGKRDTEQALTQPSLSDKGREECEKKRRLGSSASRSFGPPQAPSNTVLVFPSIISAWVKTVRPRKTPTGQANGYSRMSILLGHSVLIWHREAPGNEQTQETTLFKPVYIGLNCLVPSPERDARFRRPLRRYSKRSVPNLR